MQPLQFFIDNIGKRIYRDPDGCPCHTCKDIEENGIIIGDEQQANYMYDVQCEFKAEGTDLNYRLTKEK